MPAEDSCAAERIVETTAAIGAEAGDPHLNAFGSSAYPNRDHETRWDGVLRVEPLHSELRGAYRYVDVYSDRFDSTWSLHMHGTGNAMPGVDKREPAPLLSERSLLLGTVLGPVGVRGAGNWYSSWGATPYFHGPIRTDAACGGLCSGIRLARSTADVNAWVARRTRYLDYEPVEDTHVRGEAAATRRVGGYATAGLVCSYDSDLKQAARFSGAVSVAGAATASAGLSLGATSEGQPFGACTVVLPLGRRVVLESRMAADYDSPRDDLSFRHLDTLVRCAGTAHRSTNLHAAAAYVDTLPFPLRLEVWADLCSAPLWLAVDRRSTEILLSEQVSPRGALGTVGGRLRYRAGWSWLALGVFGEGRAVVSGVAEQLSVPYRLGCDAVLQSRRYRGLAAQVLLETVGPVSQRYLALPAGQVEKHTAEARTSVWVEGSVPVLLPVFRSRTGVVLQVRCGPLNLFGESRARQHPQGNLYGPRIEVLGHAWLTRRQTVPARAYQSLLHLAQPTAKAP